MWGNENLIKMPFSAKECSGKNYEIIKNQFKDMGFNNIDVTTIADIKKFDIFKKENTIYSVTINGDDKFKKNQKVDINSIVRITYHIKSEIDEKVLNENNDKGEI